MDTLLIASIFWLSLSSWATELLGPAIMKLQGQIIVDPRPNLMLERGGFRDTWIGRDRIGLSKLWHGVRIVKKVIIILRKCPFLQDEKALLSCSFDAGQVN